MTKIAIESISFPSGEGYAHWFPKTCTNFKEANSFLYMIYSSIVTEARVAKRDPANSGYNKTDFLITWEDGAEYSGRYDVTGKKGPDLQKQVEENIKMYAEVWTPYWWKENELANFKAENRQKENALNFLNNYEL